MRIVQGDPIASFTGWAKHISDLSIRHRATGFVVNRGRHPWYLYYYGAPGDPFQWSATMERL